MTLLSVCTPRPTDFKTTRKYQQLQIASLRGSNRSRESSKLKLHAPRPTASPWRAAMQEKWLGWNTTDDIPRKEVKLPQNRDSVQQEPTHTESQFRDDMLNIVRQSTIVWQNIDAKTDSHSRSAGDVREVSPSNKTRKRKDKRHSWPATKRQFNPKNPLLTPVKETPRRRRLSKKLSKMLPETLLPTPIVGASNGRKMLPAPTLLYYSPGKAPEQYNGARELDALAAFVEAKAGGGAAAAPAGEAAGEKEL